MAGGAACILGCLAAMTAERLRRQSKIRVFLPWPHGRKCLVTPEDAHTTKSKFNSFRRPPAGTRAAWWWPPLLLAARPMEGRAVRIRRLRPAFRSPPARFSLLCHISSPLAPRSLLYLLLRFMREWLLYGLCEYVTLNEFEC